MKYEKRIVTSPEIMHGKPVVKGTRVTVSAILNLMAAGLDMEAILAEFPDLAKEDVLACLEYSSRLAEDRMMDRSEGRIPDTRIDIISRGDALQATARSRTGRIKEFVDAINVMGDHAAGRLQMTRGEARRSIEKDLRRAARDLGKRLIIEKANGKNPQLYFRVHLPEDSAFAGRIKQIGGFFGGARLFYLGTSLLLAFAASVPLWISRVTDGKVIPVESQAMIGLVALMIAMLSLVGALTYIRLRAEVHEQVRESIEQPMLADSALGQSYALFREYFKSPHHQASVRDDCLDPGFQSALMGAIQNARYALDICRLHMNQPEYRRIKLSAINELAYHQATLHLHRPEEAMKQEAMALVAELKQEAGDDWYYWETVVWVMIRCHKKDTLNYSAGVRIVEDLLRRGDIPDYGKAMLRQKYGYHLSKNTTTEASGA